MYKPRINIFLLNVLIVTLIIAIITAVFIGHLRSEELLLIKAGKSQFAAGFSHLKYNVIACSVAIESLFLALGFVLLWERGRYEARLRELAESRQTQLTFLQTLVDTIPSPIFYKDRAGRYLGHNKAFGEFLGMKGEEIVGKSVFELAPPDLARRYFEKDEELFRTPGVQIYEASVLYADGTRHDVIFNKATFAGADGEVAGLVGVILDVTERKKAQAVIAESEQFLSSIIDSIQDGITILDRELTITRLNPVTRRISGGRAEVGRKCYQSFHGRQEQCTPCPSSETVQTGQPARKTFPVVKEGDERWLEISTFPLFDAAKIEVTGVIEYIRDVTDRKRAEDLLRESEERFHQLFAQNLDGIILFGADDHRIIDANPRAQELTRFTLSELKELTPATILDPPVELSEAGSRLSVERGVCTRKDGSALSVSIWSQVITLGDRLVVYCSLRDMTAKIRLEEEVRSAQAKLIHANKMTSLGLLASSVAHEINNPNNCIGVNAAILTDVWRDAAPILERYRQEHGDFALRGLSYDQMRDFAPQLFNGITDSSRRISAIVDNMKEWVRQDKSGLHGAIDINRLVQSASAMLWHHIHRHTDNFQMELAEGLPPALGNAQQIEQVIINLLVNALQSLPHRACGVVLATSHDPVAGRVLVTVRDEGAGIDAGDLKRLKEPFFTTREGGTGLGLYISSAIVKEHGGSLTFDSAPGRGTTVTVAIPEKR
ncbi:PAS domain S-box protein [Geomonas sp.]|uniref:PAS domain-containing sensor histidine kinase n=1 Tax=Geomonas sp. TaxID=2651584 RepID=UPI002B48149C|nr:PAS domain S-box protein [Geomonas sp.]HJV36850.1 PAS domain S-box protein [Geomonas sp.]